MGLLQPCFLTSIQQILFYPHHSLCYILIISHILYSYINRTLSSTQSILYSTDNSHEPLTDREWCAPVQVPVALSPQQTQGGLKKNTSTEHLSVSNIILIDKSYLDNILDTATWEWVHWVQNNDRHHINLLAARSYQLQRRYLILIKLTWVKHADVLKIHGFVLWCLVFHLFNSFSISSFNKIRLNVTHSIFILC